MNTAPRFLNETQFRGLNKLGDVMLPGQGELRAFSSVGAARHADRVLAHMGAQDLKDLKLLLTLLAFFPRFAVALLLRFLELSPAIPGPAGGLLRFMRLGLRGLVMTLYYCDPQVHAAIGYHTQVYTGDQDAVATPSSATGTIQPSA